MLAPACSGIEGDGGAVGLDEEGVGDVWDETVRGGEADVPVGDGLGECERKFVGRKLPVLVKSQRVVVGCWLVGGVSLRVPVNGGEDGERVGAV